jgi:ectoine hydroxylase-related dioxygenase (phytanoyl-CoA dioxygenase family)
MFSDVRKKVFKYLVAFKYTEKEQIKTKKQEVKAKKEIKEEVKTKKEEVKIKKEEIKTKKEEVKTKKQEIKTKKQEVKTKKEEVKTKKQEIKTKKEEVKEEVKAKKEIKEEVKTKKEEVKTKKEEVQPPKEPIQVLQSIVLEEALQTNIKELEENGYTIIRNVYNNEEIEEYKREFFDWYKNTKDVEKLHQIIHGNGIFKYFEIGHQRFTWLARTNPKIISIFKHLWNCDELVTGFDGCCYYPSDYKKEDIYWIHTDQSSHKKGCHCYQSFLSLTSNNERTLLIYKGSHLLHEHYFKTLNIDTPRDWCVLDKNYVSNLEDKKVYVKVNAGDLVVWDSRTFHQNTCGDLNCNEERLVQYLCYLPKNNIKNDKIQQNLRREYFEENYTTSHWPYPLTSVPLQPYYNQGTRITIDYASLPKPKLDDLKEEIEKLL